MSPFPETLTIKPVLSILVRGKQGPETLYLSPGAHSQDWNLSGPQFLHLRNGPISYHTMRGKQSEVSQVLSPVVGNMGSDSSRASQGPGLAPGPQAHDSDSLGLSFLIYETGTVLGLP